MCFLLHLQEFSAVNLFIPHVTVKSLINLLNVVVEIQVVKYAWCDIDGNSFNYCDREV